MVLGEDVRGRGQIVPEEQDKTWTGRLLVASGDTGGGFEGHSALTRTIIQLH